MKKSKKKHASHSSKGKKNTAQPKKFNEKVQMDKGIEFFQKRDYHAALIEWRKIAAPDEKWKQIIAEAHFRKGLEMYYHGRNQSEVEHNQLISELSQATKLHPGNAYYHYHLGLAFEHQGNLKKAAASYLKAVKVQKNDRFLFQLVMTYLKSEMVAKAVEITNLVTDKTTRAMLNLMRELASKDENESIELNIDDEIKNHPLNSGLIALAKQNPNQALQSFENPQKIKITQDPVYDQALAAYFQGVAYLQLGDDKKADKKFEFANDRGLKGEQFKHNLITALWKKSIKYAESANFAPASRLFDAIHSLAPDLEPIQHNINLLKFHFGNELAGYEKYQEAIKFWKDCTLKGEMNRFHNIAIAYEHLDDYKSANSNWRELILYWKTQLRRNPEQSQYKDHLIIAHKRLGDSYLKNNEIRQAIKEFSEVLHYAPDDVDTLLKQGDLYSESENWSRAGSVFKKILEIQPDHIDALLSLSFAYEMEYAIDLALRCLNKVLDLEPGNPQAITQKIGIYHDEAVFHWEDEEYFQAIINFEKVIKLAPERYEGYEGLAHLYFHIDEEEKVEPLFHRYLEHNPENPVANVSVGAFYLEYDEVSKSDKFFQTAEKLSAKNPQILFSIGCAYFENDNHKKGLNYFSRLAKLPTVDFEILYEIGLYLAPFYPDRAITFFNKCLKLQPDNPDILNLLLMLHQLLGFKTLSHKQPDASSPFEIDEAAETKQKKPKAIPKNKNQLDLF
jgi:tetratricopeptide (TPR) repeat protein